MPFPEFYRDSWAYPAENAERSGYRIFVTITKEISSTVWRNEKEKVQKAKAGGRTANLYG